jgi:hypothetical protein
MSTVAHLLWLGGRRLCVGHGRRDSCVTMSFSSFDNALFYPETQLEFSSHSTKPGVLAVHSPGPRTRSPIRSSNVDT